MVGTWRYSNLLLPVVDSILFMVVPVYIAEIAPSELRGRLVSSIGVTVTGGILLGYFVNLGCAEFTFGWRISLSFQSVFMLIFTLGMIVMPESPRYVEYSGIT